MTALMARWRVMQLTEPPRLQPPTTAVRESWLAAERAYVAETGASTVLLGRGIADFAGLAAERQGTLTMWAVPTTIYWYVSGEHYLGELVIRHKLTPALSRSGGHIGYSVAAAWRRQGHATAMLAAALVECRRLGLSRVLITCDPGNIGSRKVILANGGVPDGQSDGEDRFWITLADGGRPGSRSNATRPGSGGSASTSRRSRARHAGSSGSRKSIVPLADPTSEAEYVWPLKI